MECAWHEPWSCPSEPAVPSLTNSRLFQGVRNWQGKVVSSEPRASVVRGSGVFLRVSVCTQELFDGRCYCGLDRYHKWHWCPFFRDSMADARRLAGLRALPLSSCHPSARPRAFQPSPKFTTVGNELRTLVAPERGVLSLPHLDLVATRLSLTAQGLILESDQQGISNPRH